MPPVSDRSTPTKVCVVGAGPSGLAAIKNLQEAGFAVEAFDRADDVGGNWYYGQPNSSVYRSAHLISSKRLTQYPDFPMPDDWPEYPSQEQCLTYLREYARHFELYASIRFGQSVERIEPADPAATRWRVTLAGGETREYDVVIIANGHHWDPLWPSYPGHFDGVTLHSSQYKTPEVLIGRRVLVVGGGNSGCDLAVEAATHAAHTLHSLRRGYHFVPKFIKGKPADRCGEFLLRWHVPLWLRRRLTARAVRTAIGLPEDFGLPKPDHKLLETHPIINSQMLYFVGHGRITPKPDVAELCGNRVRFTDGSEEPVDVLIYATGFRITFPFLDAALVPWREGRPELFLNAFHPQHDNLFFAGLIQPDSGIWGLVHYQTKLLGKYLQAKRANARVAEKFWKLATAATRDDLSAGIRYVRTPRHALEVEHFSYRKRLKKLLAMFD